MNIKLFDKIRKMTEVKTTKTKKNEKVKNKEFNLMKTKTQKKTGKN